jgi:hypothetical protein
MQARLIIVLLNEAFDVAVWKTFALVQSSHTREVVRLYLKVRRPSQDDGKKITDGQQYKHQDWYLILREFSVISGGRVLQV